MDVQMIRAMQAQISMELGKMEQRRKVLLALQGNYDEWLRLEEGEQAMQIPLPAPGTDAVAGAGIEVAVVVPAGADTPSLKHLVLQVIRSGAGREMHGREIHQRLEAMGRSTTAQRNPAGIMDLFATRLQREGQPIEKVGARTWKWVGGDADAAPAGQLVLKRTPARRRGGGPGHKQLLLDWARAHDGRVVMKDATQAFAAAGSFKDRRTAEKALYRAVQRNDELRRIGPGVYRLVTWPLSDYESNGSAYPNGQAS